MADVVNLRIARKRAARASAEEDAARNRVASGLSKHERTQASAERQIARQTLDGRKLNTPDKKSGDRS